MHYTELAESVKERVEKEKTISVQNLMNNMKHLSPNNYKNNKALSKKRLLDSWCATCQKRSLFFDWCTRKWCCGM